MQVTKSHDGTMQWLTLAGFITRTALLKRILPRWPKMGGMFNDAASNRIAEYCLEVYRQTKEAPGLSGLTPLVSKLTDGGNIKESDETSGACTLLSSAVVPFAREGRFAEMTDKQVIAVACECLNHQRGVKLNEQYNKDVMAGKGGNVLVKTHEPLDLSSKASRYDKVAIRPVDWLWEGVLARGEFTLLEGKSAVGKTTLLIDLAARASRGWGMPPDFERDVVRDPIKVLLIRGSEDSPEVIAAKLSAAGANLKYVYEPAKTALSLPQDLPLIEGIVEDKRIGLVLVTDSMLNMTGGVKMDNNAENHVRAMVNPFVEMLRTHRVAAMGIRHYRKESGDSLSRGMGSQAWTAIARLQFAVGKVDEEEDDYYTFAASKNNLGEKAKSLSYTIEGTEISAPDPDREGRKLRVPTCHVIWGGECDVSANDISMGKGRKRGRPSQLDDVAQFIALQLGDGEVETKVLFDRVAAAYHCGRDTFKRACKEARVQKRKDGYGKDGTWYSYLEKGL